MSIRAVVFDLFHTLVDPEPHYPPGLEKRTVIASIAGVEPEGLAAFWVDTYVERETTTIDLVDLFDRHCVSLGRQLTPADRTAIDEVLGIGVDRSILEPDRAIVELLEGIRSRAAIGVLSNCHEREVRCWDRSPLASLCDAFGRSSRIGVMKPHPSTYAWLLDQLDVKASDAIYVGNGAGDELAGAKSVGFASVIHCNVYDRAARLVALPEQCRRAAQADASADSLEDLSSVILAALD